MVKMTQNEPNGTVVIDVQVRILANRRDLQGVGDILDHPLVPSKAKRMQSRVGSTATGVCEWVYVQTEACVSLYPLRSIQARYSYKTRIGGTIIVSTGFNYLPHG